MGRCADAFLLLLGAEKAESVADEKEVVQDRLDLVGCILGSAARLVPLMGADVTGPWCVYGGRQSYPPAQQHQQPHRGPLGIPGSTGLLSPASLHLQGKNAQKPFSTSEICSYARVLGRNLPQLCPPGCALCRRRALAEGQPALCRGTGPRMSWVPDAPAGVWLSGGSAGMRRRVASRWRGDNTSPALR